MGMFDTVKLEHPSLVNVFENDEGQTKNFDCWLTTFKVTEDGRLLNEAGEDLNFEGKFSIIGEYSGQFIDRTLHFVNGNFLYSEPGRVDDDHSTQS